MYICEKCHNTFEEPKELKNMGGDIGESDYCCPWCGYTEEFSEVIECAICGEIVRESETEECVCEKCLNKYAGRKHAFQLGDKNKDFVFLNGFVVSFFDEKEVEQILREVLVHRYWESDIDEKGKEYCLDDKWEFANYLKKEGVYE